MTKADRGSLAERLEQVGGPAAATRADVLLLATTLRDGLARLHASGVVHRDLTPNNLLITASDDGHRSPTSDRAVFRADERLLIADLGLAKDMTVGIDILTILGGTPRFQAPEQTVPMSVIDHRADIHAATAVLWQLVSGSLPPAEHERDARLTELSEQWRRFIERGMAIQPSDRHASIDEWYEAVAGLVEHGVHALTPPLPDGDINPYPGLAAYRRDRAAFYSGREALIDEVTSRLQTERAVVVGGASGAGKSSLLHAGVATAIAAGHIDSHPRWQVVSFTPGAQPLQRLVDAVRPDSRHRADGR